MEERGSEPRARPLTARCAAALAQRDHACIGVSPFNGYFTPERVATLAAWALRQFDGVHFFVPDLPAAYTLQALGYPPARAAHKARRQGDYLKNKIRRALNGLGIHDPQPYILDWRTLEADPAYIANLTAAHALYDHDTGFRDACVQATRWVLDGRRPRDGGVLDDRRLGLAVRYFLAELPLFLDTVTIVNRRASVFCYHQSPPFLQRLYRGEFACAPAPGQGYAVVKPGDDRRPSPARPERVRPASGQPDR